MMGDEIDVSLDVESPFRITKWKVKSGTKISKGCLLGLYEFPDKSQTLKFKADKTHVGTVLDVLVKEKELVEVGSILLKVERCKHPTIMKDMCAECGADLKKIQIEMDFQNSKKTSFTPTVPNSKTASVAMVHSIPELRVSKEEAETLGRADQWRLLRDRKLVLVVDLDQTLIHTTNEIVDPKITDIHHFQLCSNGPWYHTRVRPHTEKFLENMNRLYELQISTFGSRMYAHTVAKFIDAEGKFFSHRILSRDECFDPSSKTANLKDLFPCGDSMVAIIDDREDVWNCIPNLIPVRAYAFFQGTGDINAPPGARDLRRGQTGTTQDFSESGSKLPKTIEGKTSDEDREVVDIENNQTEASVTRQIVSKTNEETLKKNDVASKNDPANVKNIEGRSPDTSVSDTSLSANSSSVDFGPPQKKDTLPDEEDESGRFTQETLSGDENADGDGESKRKLSEAKVENEVGADEGTPVLECDSLWTESGDKETEETTTDVGETEEKANGDDQDGETEGIRIEEDDDYLIYLEDVLKRIHAAFYELYDQNEGQAEERKVPDLKHVMPYVKKKILKGVNLVFSGVIPYNVIPERHKIFRTALALGANVQRHFVESGADRTTHVVAARLGTEKVLRAQRTDNPQVHVVTPHWLWSCAERWERVDERVFELTKQTEIHLDDVRSRSGRSSPTVLPPGTGRESRKAKRKVNGDKESEGSRPGFSDISPDELSSGTVCDVSERPEKRCKLGLESDSSSKNENQEDIHLEQEGLFADVLNPFMRFSKGDLEHMDKEVNDLVSSDEDDSDNDSEKEDAKLRQLVLHGSPGGSSGGGSSPRGHGSRESDSDDSLSGDYPRGWGIPKRQQSSPRDPSDPEDLDLDTLEGVETTRQDVLLREEDVLSDDDDDDEDQDSIGSVDEDMAAALEQEILGKQFIAFSSKDEIGKNN